MTGEKLLIFLLLFAVASSFFFVGHHLSASSNNFKYTDVTFGKIINKVFIGDDKPTKLVFVGDILLARDIEKQIKLNGFEYPFSQVKNFFKDAYVLGNFESSIPKIHVSTPDLNTRFSVDTNNLEALVKAKVTHLSLANNHSLDFGDEDYLHTLSQLELHGFEAFGHGEKVATSSIKYLQLNDQALALVAISTVAAYPDKNDWLPVIEKAKQGSDIVVVYIHWGDEYKNIHNQVQQKFAHELVDAGVDLIVGHHPHVVQDIEEYKNKLIFYSLGNFVFDQYFSNEVQIGLALEFSFQDEKAIINLVPVSSIENRGQPKIMTADEKNNFLSNLAKRSSSEISQAIMFGQLEF
jgi:gamma-polyglutamate biosynthesis protein CapA